MREFCSSSEPGAAGQQRGTAAFAVRVGAGVAVDASYIGPFIGRVLTGWPRRWPPPNYIVARTGLGRALVNQRLSELLAPALIAEGGFGASTGGRAPRTVHFNAGAGRVLAADLGATGVDVALADLAGNLLAHRREATNVMDGPEKILGSIGALMDSQIATTQKSR